MRTEQRTHPQSGIRHCPEPGLYFLLVFLSLLKDFRIPALQFQKEPMDEGDFRRQNQEPDGHEQDALKNGQKAAYDAQDNEKPANDVTPDLVHAFFNTRPGP